MRHVGFLALLFFFTLGVSNSAFANLKCRFVISTASGPTAEGHILEWAIQEPGRALSRGTYELSDTDFVDEEVLVPRANGEPAFLVRWSAVTVDEDPGYRLLRVQSILSPGVNKTRTVFGRDVENAITMELTSPLELDALEKSTFQALAGKLGGSDAADLHMDTSPDSLEDFNTRERALVPEWSKSPIRQNKELQRVYWDGHNPEQFFDSDDGANALPEYIAFYNAIVGNYGSPNARKSFAVNVWTVPFAQSNGAWKQVVAVEFYNNESGATSTFSFVRPLR